MTMLDTHAWFFWVTDNINDLSEKALENIQSAETLGVSIISCWEIAMLVSKERVKLNIDTQVWIEKAVRYQGLKLVQLDPEIAVMSTRLPGQFHGDPADRMIAATCLKYQSPLISKDRKIQAWGYINTIW